MKVIVKKVFIDKDDALKAYAVGETLSLTDTARVKDLVDRGLVEVVDEPKPEKTTKATKKK